MARTRDEAVMVTILIPMMPPREASPNWSGPWQRKAWARREFRECAGWATREWASGRGLGGDFWAEQLLAGAILDAEIAWCCRRKRMDDDNAKAALKAAIDGIADVLWGGEDRHVTIGTVSQTRGAGVTRVTLREARDTADEEPAVAWGGG